MIGQTFSHYKIVEKLGGGGMGIVYKAQDLKLNRPVVLKLLPPDLTSDPDAKQRFIHEAQAASALDHRNICVVHDVDQSDDGQFFIVMAFYDGETLKKRLERGPLDIDQAMDIAAQISSGLARAHDAGIVHRDIKPANIMLTSRNEAKILDFGLAKLSSGSLATKSGTTMGTAAYMSPEQARAEQVDHRADIWAVGTVLYELLTGRRAFESDYAQALVYSIVKEEPRPLREIRPEVPEAVEQIIRKAMAKDPGERYQTAKELLSDLNVASGQEATGGTIAAAKAYEKQQRKKMLAWVVGAGVVAVLLALGVFVGLPLLKDQALASDPRTIAVIGFENLTGDKTLDKHRLVLLDAIITSLEQSKYIHVMTRQRLADILKQLGKKDAETVDSETGLAICRREGAQLMAVGTYASVGDRYRTTLKLVDVKTLETVSNFKAEGTGEESLLTQVDDLCREVSRKIGVSERRTEQTIRPITEISTSSVEAYGLYMRGTQEYDRCAWFEARRYLELAVQRDSQYAIAWWRLGYALGWLGDSKGADSAIKKAASLAWRAGEKEQWAIGADDSLVRAKILGLPDLSYIDFLKLRAERYPKEKEFLSFYGNTLNIFMHKPEEAVPVLEKALELDPTFVPTLGSLGYAYAWMGETEKALETFKRQIAAAPADPNSYDSMGNILDEKGRYDEAEKYYRQALAVNPRFVPSQYSLIVGKIRREDYAGVLQMLDSADIGGAGFAGKTNELYQRACLAFWTGQLNEADRLLEKLEVLRIKAGQPANHGFDWLRVWIAYERGQFAQSRRFVDTWAEAYLQVALPGDAVTPLRKTFIELCRGFISVKEGKADSVAASLARMDSIRALIPVSDSSRQSKEMDLAYQVYSRVLKSAWLLSKGEAQEAMTVRPKGPHDDASGAYDVPETGLASWDFLHLPVMVDVLPRAYLAMDQLDSGVASYERAVSWRDGAIIPRYHYRLALAYERKGMKANAIAEYEKFLKIWGKADPMYKEPADARARMARLRKSIREL